MIYSIFAKTAAHVFFLSILHALLLTSAASQSPQIEGRELQCCTLMESPMAFEDPSRTHTHGFAGIAIQYLGLLEDRLGFRCKTLRLFNASKPERQSFTGFIYEMEECTKNGKRIDSPRCQCDIGVGAWAQNAERFGRVDFPVTFANDDFRMMTHVDNINPGSVGGAFFITAFSVMTWIAIFGLVLCFVFLKLFDRKFIPPDPRLMNLPDDATWMFRVKHYLTSTKLVPRLTRATKNTLLEIIGQSTDEIHWDSTNNCQWIITYFILLCGLFLILAYEATMTASLVQEVAQSDFRTLDDLKDCRIQAKDVCIPRGGAAFAFWHTTIASSPCHRGAPPARVVDSFDEGHLLVATKECKFFLASGATTKYAAHGRFCGQVEVTGEPFFITGSAFILPKGSDMTEAISNVTLELRVSDEVDTVDRFLRKRGECQKASDVSLTFGRLNIFFITAFTGCLIMFALMVFYPLVKKQRKKSIESDERSPTEQAKEIDSFSEASYPPAQVCSYSEASYPPAQA